MPAGITESFVAKQPNRLSNEKIRPPTTANN